MGAQISLGTYFIPTLSNKTHSLQFSPQQPKNLFKNELLFLKELRDELSSIFHCGPRNEQPTPNVATHAHRHN